VLRLLPMQIIKSDVGDQNKFCLFVIDCLINSLFHNKSVLYTVV